MISFQLETIILSAIAITNAFFGVSLVFKGAQTRTNKIFFLILFNLAFWSGVLAWARNAINPEEALYITRILYGVAAIIPYLFLLFALRFPEEKQHSLFPLLASVPFFVVLVLSVFSDGVVRHIALDETNDISEFGSFYWLYALYLISYFFIGVFVVVKKYVYSPPHSVERIQLGFVFVGVVIPIIVGITTNMYFLYVLENFTYRWIGPTSTLSMTFFFAYAIYKHHLFNLKVITTEIFSFTLIAIFFLQFLLSENTEQFVVNGFVLAAVITVGILLIRAVLKEVRDRERISELAKNLRESNEELMRLDQAKSEFLSIASHQLRAPLTSIKGFASLLIEGSFGSLNEREMDALSKIFQSSNQLVKIIDDLLNLSRIESGKIRYEMKESDLFKIVEMTLRQLKPNADTKNLTIQFDNASFPEAVVARFDPGKIQEAITNLLDNAMKYSPKYGTITARLTRKKDSIYFEVADNGIGISKEDQKRIFTKFTRTQDAMSVDSNGMGIGLYFVKRVIEDHGGRVGVSSEGAGKGATFFIELPIQ